MKDSNLLVSHCETRANEPLRIYVAGPYTPRRCSLHDAARIAQHNVDRAIEVAVQLIEKGHYVYIPHLTHYIHIHRSCNRDYGEYYYELDLSFLIYWANSLYYIAPSEGSDRELRLAEDLGYRIFRSIDEVPDLRLDLNV